jgi:hypothetical protein
MSILKPYKLIWRPNKNGSAFKICSDPVYSSDRFFFLNSYYLLEKDLKEIFEFVYPTLNNKDTYSHRIYELFLRACTEFESNSKNILNSNGYISPNTLRIFDYFKINKSSKLSEYEIKINIWDGPPTIIKPFSSWTDTKFAPLNWYQDYNLAKHDRHNNFQKANFMNLINSVGAVLIILYSQYSFLALNQYNNVSMYDQNDDGFSSTDQNLFSVKSPTWSDSDMYDFNWESIKASANPFDNFAF